MKIKEKRILVALLCGAMSLSYNFASVSAADTTTTQNEAASDDSNLNEYNLDEYIVTANRMNVEKKQVAADTVVIDQKDIERNKYDNISDALQHNNINIAKHTGSSYPIINGDNRVLVLVDGRQVNWNHLTVSGADGAGVDIDALPMDNVARIEIVRGPNSSLYGNSAVGGVVNIITKRPEEGQKTTVRLEAGTWNARKGVISTQGSNGDFGYLVTLNKEKRDSYDYRTPSGKTNKFIDSEIDRTSETIRLDKKFGNDRLTFDFSNQEADDGYSIYLTDLEDGTSSYNDLGNKQKRTERNFAFTYNFDFENGNTTDFIRVYQNKENVKTQYGRDAYKGDYEHNLKTNGLDMQKAWNISDNDTLVGGLSYMKEYIDSTSGGSTLDRSSDTKAAFLENHWNMKDGWSLNTGARLENHSVFGSHVTSHASVNKELSDATNMYLSWGQGVKNPTLNMRFANTPSMIGNPDLKPEKAETWTLGVNSELSKDTHLEASVYTSKVKDALMWIWGPLPGYDNGITKYFNAQEEKRRGLELNLSHVLSPQWKVRAGYSYSKVEWDKNGAGFENYDPNNRPNGYMLGLSYTQDKWDGDLSLNRVTGLSKVSFSDNAYTTLDLGVNYHPTKDTTVYVKGYNLTNEGYEVEGRFQGSPINSGHPMPSRYFVFGVEQSF